MPETLILYRDPDFHAAFPSLVAGRHGGALLFFRRAPDDNALLRAKGIDDPALMTVDHIHARSHHALVRLDAALRPKPVEMLPVDPLVADQDPSVLRLRSGRLICFAFSWRGVPPLQAKALQASGVRLFGRSRRTGLRYLLAGCHARMSDDDGESWGPRIALPLPVPAALRGRPVELPDGSVLAAVYYRHGRGRRAALVRLCGETAEDLGPLGTDHRHPVAEPALVSWQGKLHVFHRSMAGDDRIRTQISDDEGRTWSNRAALDPLGHPCDPVVLADGRLLVVYGHRHPPFGVRALIFETPTRAREIEIDGTSPGPDTGYPSVAQLQDGRVLIAWYAADDQGVRHIRGKLFDPRFW